ncbi:hypothetical protein Ahy_A01g000522 isoform C [Arachis hypogaea]|uniref:ABC transporter domain-containing protein n=1 Tax=Arachis hypogaea TaxID=3818 RepID=A0A445EKD6_ARAHY|nr:hypothetical protein Ahy_A01g000522 isoform C [Arachis hypogaea]
MAQQAGVDEIESLRIELAEIGRSIRSSFRSYASSFRSNSSINPALDVDNNEGDALQWGEIQRLPTFERITSALLDVHDSIGTSREVKGRQVVDVSKLGAQERHLFIEKLIKHIENDNLRLLQKFRKRIDKMTLLLGPPGSGKTTLLLALAGKLDHSLKGLGEISYNGHTLEEFIPPKSSAYVSQYDLHIPEMTVRETLDFSARCQGVGSKDELLKEVSRREKEAGIMPDPDLDAYMKATSVKGLKRTLQTDYILKILGLDICADTLVGDPIRRGISGGQKKRLTTGEMMVGPTRALFMDEISNGLDSSTTFQIISCLQHMVHITDATALISLLQPAPETFDLFDDIVLMAEGKIVYHGPRDCIVEFFEDCGFQCPQRKGTADFLQEVISRKDQAQYWSRVEEPYSYVTVEQFIEKFKHSSFGKKLGEEISKPFDKSQSHKNALAFRKYSLTKWELFRACIMRELLLMKRNSFVYIFKSTQLVIVASIGMTVFIRTRMSVDALHGNYFMGSLFYSLIILLVDGIPELSMTVSRLSVFYKQKELYFYPAWAYSIPSAVLKIPLSLLESFIWTALTYYVIGYSPEIGRFFRQFLLLFTLHMSAISMFRFVASVFQNVAVATTAGTLTILYVLLFGGFILPKPYMPSWLRWGFWISPLSYGELAVTVNEFLAPRWQKMSTNTTLGRKIMDGRGLNFDGYFYWISIGALLGFTVLFNTAFTLVLSFFKAPSRSRALISSDKHSELQGNQENNDSFAGDSTLVESTAEPRKGQHSGGMVLPFQPLTLTFRDVQYYVDTTMEMRNRGFDKQLQLLCDVTGSLRPGILTALMGVSGAGKTTLLDVLCGRKTGGTIEGDIRIDGYPKVQETFARISGYCEQNDIHSPNITVEESVMFSAWLRLPPQIDAITKSEFVKEVLRTIELDGIKDSLVGLPNVSGLSTEQRKRLTIAIELVANPSIIFMDEPTSGLDARAAAVVMRAVKNVVGTGRTVTCTIHQPSIDIFESFDELILMKTGGCIIYSGPLGKHSSRVIEYFESIPGMPKIKDNYNPSTWMLEVTSGSAEIELGVDFAQIYRESTLYEDNQQDLFNIFGSMFIAILFFGINNGSSVLPVVATERTVLYREKFAGMYSPWAYSFAQVTIEVPYLLTQAVLYVIITYPMIGYHWSAYKIFWSFYSIFCNLLYFNYLGMVIVSFTPNVQVASIACSSAYTMLNLFSGYIVPRPQIPKWWIWMYYLCPTSWALNGLLTSQYGDINKEISVTAFTDAKTRTIAEFLRDYYGFHHDLLGVTALILIVFPVIFALLFAYCIGHLNFLRRVGIKLPTVEVRYQNLTIEAECQVVKGKPIPTLWNTLKGWIIDASQLLILRSRKSRISIIKDANGIIKPGRMTLLLGPPGCGKTTLLLALAGRLDHSLKVKGEISYNGHPLEEFIPQKSSAYVSQYDLHIPEMTVRETLDFSARCQGVGIKDELLKEVSRREKEAGIMPDRDLDAYMKATSMKGLKSTLQTDYILKILGLDVCADTLVGDPIRRGVSGGQKKRVISRNDQAQYWSRSEEPYIYVTTEQFIEKFKHSSFGKKLEEEISKPFDKSQSHKNALAFRKYSLTKWELFKACIMREFLLMKRNSFVYVFKSTQLVIVASIGMTVFIRTRMSVDALHGNYFMGSLFYSLIILLTDGYPELSMTISRLSVFYKQKELCFYPAWAYSIPSAVLKIPLSLLESFIWTALTYYVIGYSPEIGRFFRQFLLLFTLHMSSISMFRFIASVFQNAAAAMTAGTVAILYALLFGGVVLPKPYMPSWLRWGFWISPLSYGELAVTVNEFLAPRWQKMSANTTLGHQIMESRGLNFDGYFYWISIGALLGLTVLFNTAFTLVLSFFKVRSRSRALISSDKHSELQGNQENNGSFAGNITPVESTTEPEKGQHSGGMVLPFQPLTLAFRDVQYYVDPPMEMRNQGFSKKQLQLLCDVTGSLRPGILTALMGVSGAGKTTLLDVLCGRKTGGTIEGDIRIGGYQKVQETFTRISGYCEQNDIHSPNITVEESVMFSAWLRLPPQIDAITKSEFVKEVLHTIELDQIKDSLVGLPNVSGLSTEQRKQLTIAIELVANPSIIFMDEPTSGLDARAAAVVMRAVKNVVRTGRTVACTIHQPSIDIFESFDELILMKTGGRIIYSGPLGQNSSQVIEYFESIPRVPKIKDNYNPSTWMLEVTSCSAEVEIGVDFAQIYRESTLYEQNKELVEQLSSPAPGSKDLHFPSHFPQNGWEQFKACLWKQHLSYWRSPSYNLMRIIFVIAASLLFGILFWKKGKNIDNQQDLFNVFGSMFIAALIFGINNFTSVLPIVATERTVLYREKFAGMYSPWAYSFAQVIIEVPYLLTQAVLYVIITYPMIGYHCSAYKIFWSLYSMFCNLLYFNYLGMFIVSFTPNVQVASIVCSSAYTMLTLFSGFIVPHLLIKGERLHF